MHILVVDDDPMAGGLIAAVLEDAGHDIVLVEDGAQALDALASEHGLTGVISDMTMPGLSGLDLLQAMRERRIDLPFILLSGDDPEKLRDRGDFAACLRKDGDLADTLPAIVESAFKAGGGGGHD
jgi:CheY-like chemotaxis protein